MLLLMKNTNNEEAATASDMNIQPGQQDDTIPTRKTRLSFELHPSLIMEDMFDSGELQDTEGNTSSSSTEEPRSHVSFDGLEEPEDIFDLLVRMSLVHSADKAGGEVPLEH